MKTKLLQAGYTEQGIEKFIETTKSVLSHTPGNWEFISIESKLSFIRKNKEYIANLLDEALPRFSDEEMQCTNWMDNPDKNKRYADVRSAIITLRAF